MLKRNIKITFRLNAKEHQQLKKNVKKTGLSQETYIRTLLAGYAPKELPPPDYHSMMRELNAIGNRSIRSPPVQMQRAFSLLKNTPCTCKNFDASLLQYSGL